MVENNTYSQSIVRVFLNIIIFFFFFCAVLDFDVVKKKNKFTINFKKRKKSVPLLLCWLRINLHVQYFDIMIGLVLDFCLSVATIALHMYYFNIY